MYKRYGWRLNSVERHRKIESYTLGGLQEIGKNITVFEYGNEIIVVDCGVAFPEDELLGIDLVIPDFTYLVKNKEKIRAIILTHGHEDHIGAIPYLLKEVQAPVYATTLTHALLKFKLAEHGLLDSVDLKTVFANQAIQLGAFSVEFIRTNHSIADSVALAIHTPVGTVVHTSDFKIDHTPIEGESTDLGKFAELGRKGVLLMLADSTNVEREGYTMSERTVGVAFEEIFMKAPGRIIVATFASNVHRIQQVINASVMFGRKVAICGRSIVNVVTAATEAGYMTIPDGTLIDSEDMEKYRPVVIRYRYQGEPSPLYRKWPRPSTKRSKPPGTYNIRDADTGKEISLPRYNELFKGRRCHL